MSARILRRREVESRTGLPTSTLYDYMADGRFPRPVKLGPRAVGWPEEAVDRWIEDRIASANAA